MGLTDMANPVKALLGGPLLIAALSTTTAGTPTWSPERAACPTPSADDYYFASGAFDLLDKRRDVDSRHWMSRHLSAAGEPSLSCGRPGNVYRFTWLRTFHHPVVVRVTEHGGQATVQATELSGRGGYEPGKVLRRVQKTLTAEQLGELRNAFAAEHFFLVPTGKPMMSVGFDGATWTVEAVDDGRYHRVERWSPKDGPIHDLGFRLLALTGWTFDEVY